MGLSCTILVTDEAISPMSSLLFQLMDPGHSTTHNIWYEDTLSCMISTLLAGARTSAGTMMTKFNL